MRDQVVPFGTVVCVLLLCIALVGVPGLAVAEDGYELTIAGSVDTPTRDVPNTDLKVSAIATSEINGSLSVTAKAPENSGYRIHLYNSDRQTVPQTVPGGDRRTGDANDVPIDLTGLQAGTYAVTIEGPGVLDFKALHPVVIEGFDTSITDAPTSATVGDEVTVDVSVDRVEGASKDLTSDRVEVVLVNGTENITTDATGANGEYSATVNTDGLELGSYDMYATVRGTEDVFGEDEVLGVSAESSIKLETPSGAGATDPSGEGGTGSTPTAPGGGDTSTPNGGTTADPGENTSNEQMNGSDETDGKNETPTGANANITTNPESDTAQAVFEPESTVDAIEFESNSVSGSVTVLDMSEAPQTAAGPPPGSSAVTVDIQVPKEAEDQSATVRMRIPTDRLAERDASAENLRVHRYANGKWNALPTRVIEETEAGVLIEADTPGFSIFTASIVSKPVADLTISPTEVTSGTTIMLDASNSTDRHGDLVAYEWRVAAMELSGQTTSVNINEPGEYTIELIVTNDAGETDTASETLTVDANDTTISPNGTGTQPEPGSSTITSWLGIGPFGALFNTLAGVTAVLVALFSVFQYKRV